jgi:hypothetical protein
LEFFTIFDFLKNKTFLNINIEEIIHDSYLLFLKYTPNKYFEFSKKFFFILKKKIKVKKKKIIKKKGKKKLKKKVKN